MSSSTGYLLAAIAFDPTIRGVLVVMVAVGVLVGSVLLLNATNTGVRTGFLITVAALTGWCFSLGIFWTIYGIGMIGKAPSWTAKEINFDRSSDTITENVDKLPITDASAGQVKSAQELLTTFELNNPEVKAQIESTEGEGFVPKSLTQVATLVPELKTELDTQLGGWRILAESDSRRGEAIASSDAAIAAAQVFGTDTTASDYTVKDVFFYGGKNAAEPETVKGERSLFQRVRHRIETTLQIKNPTLYAAITIQKNAEVVVAPGEAPPPAEIDTTASTITVILERNLGNKRVIPALFALFSGILFFVFCWMLHTRDKKSAAMRAAWDGKAS
ncbi:hypothetical protein IMCC26207_104127 [Actinobacteria bacterium IMCC26207]|nr:hypothetical protein IMCC26207_104127 [Actinobacteria bacterium IMCC26207]